MPIPGTLQLAQQQISERATIKVVSAHINKRLEDHFYYPSLASKKRLQGEVRLRFIVTTSGNIKQITIEQSSGYESLDQAAYQALAGVEQINLSQLVSKPWHEDMPLELPVVYRLK
jgi:protein TonB